MILAQEQLAPGKVEELPLVLEQCLGGGLALGSRGGSAQLLFAVEPDERDAVPCVRRAAALLRDCSADGRVRCMQLHVTTDAERARLGSNQRTVPVAPVLMELGG